jgi:hypothetical protein
MGQDAQGARDGEEIGMIHIEDWEWQLKREMLVAALDQLHGALARIANLEAQNQALKDELRRFVRAQVEP